MVDEKSAPEAETVDVDTLSTEDVDKLKRGEEIPAKEAKSEAKDAKAEKVEVDDADDTDDGSSGKRDDYVPHAKFHRANERAKAEAKGREEAEARANLAMQRMTELLNAAKPKAEEPEVDFGPDPDVDPIGWSKWRRAKDQEEYQQRQQWEQQTAQQREVETFTRQAVNTASQQYNAAKAENPQVEAAYNSLRESYANELRTLGWQGPDLVNRMNEIETGFITYAYQNRIPIQDVVLQLAQARGSWRPQADAQQVDPDRPRDASGRFAAEAAKQDKIEATKKAARSLGGSGEVVNTGAPTPEDIVNMTESEFAAFKKKYDGPDGTGAMRKAFGG